MVALYTVLVDAPAGKEGEGGWFGYLQREGFIGFIGGG
jgi:hypothetical protein